MDLTEIIPTNLEIGDVIALSGISSNSTFVSVKTEEGWVDMKTTTFCEAPLAPIDVATANAQRIYQAALEEDPTLAELVAFFLLPSGDKETKLLFSIAELPHILSKGFSNDDVDLLRSAGVIKEGNAAFALGAFKVPKKDGLSRFIVNCKPINDVFPLFREVSMNGENLYELTDWALHYKVIWSVDANAYFFHFKLQGNAKELFPVRFDRERSSITVFMDRLPMGFTLAPAIAQRTSNLITNAVRKEIQRNGWDAKVAAWIDNFIVFAHDDITANKVMSVVEIKLSHFNIKFKDRDKSGIFLGLVRSPEGLVMQKEWVSAFKKDIASIPKDHICNSKLIERILGKALWVNYAIVRQPLALHPNILALARRLPSAAGVLTLTPHEKIELDHWPTLAEGQLIKKLPMPPPRAVWSDARPNILAVVTKGTVFIALLPLNINIALAEIIAAAWGGSIYHKDAHLIIDNTTAAYALAKGHCKSAAINEIIKNYFKRGQPRGSILWICSKLQIADAPTRGAVPTGDTEDLSQGQVLKSMFFRMPFVS